MIRELSGLWEIRASIRQPVTDGADAGQIFGFFGMRLDFFPQLDDVGVDDAAGCVRG
jgi:hypothetical protein